MNNWQANRRRVVAGLSALGLTPFMSMTAFGQSPKKLPDCYKSGKIGKWYIGGDEASFTASQKLSHNGLDLWVYFKGPLRAYGQEKENNYYTLQFVIKREPSESKNIQKLTVLENDRDIISKPLKHNKQNSFTRVDLQINKNYLKKIYRPGHKWDIRTNKSSERPGVIYKYVLEFDGFEPAFKAAEELHLNGKKQFIAKTCAPLSPCFLSTAACSYVGLDDDCWELTALRHFRDRVLLSSEKGRLIVEEYYQIAPALVDKLKARADAPKQLAAIYWQCVLPCALLSKAGAHRLATKLYSRQVRLLQKLSS